MTCFMCKGKMYDKSTTFMVDLENRIVIIKNVPSQVCMQCGEPSYTTEVARQIERITKNIGTAAEITVVNYSELAA